MKDIERKKSIACTVKILEAISEVISETFEIRGTKEFDKILKRNAEKIVYAIEASED